MKLKYKDLLNKIKSFILNRKLISGLVLVVLLFAIYKLFFATSTNAQATYSIDKVARHDVVETVSESGQVSANGTVDIKSSVSGNITSIKVKAGESVYPGELLATVNSTDEYTTLQQAKLAYDQAQLNYQKSTSPAEDTSIMSAQISLQNVQNSLNQDYTSASLDLSNTYIDLANIMTSIYNSIYKSSIDLNVNDIYYYGNSTRNYENKHNLLNNSDNYIKQAISLYSTLKNNYDTDFISYKNLSSNSNNDDIYNSTNNTIDLLKEALSSIKNYIDFIQYYQNLTTEYGETIEPKTNTDLTNFKTYENTISTHLSALTTDKNNIDTNNLSIKQQNIAVSDTQTGDTGISLQEDQDSLQQAKLAYDVALNNYSKYFITSPIAGQISSISAIVGEDAGSADIATIVTKDKSVILSVPEADITKIKLGDSVNITFDAIDNFSATGTVSEIDQSGVVTSGVVSYTVKISFNDSQNIVKDGMSATANIITGTATDTLSVKSEAVKTSLDGKSYVEIFKSMDSLKKVSNNNYTATSTPIRVPVVVGLVGDDYTEIISGLKIGDIVSLKSDTSSVNNLNKNISSSNNSSGNSKKSYPTSGGGFGFGNFR